MTRVVALAALLLLAAGCVPAPEGLPRECVYRTPDGTIVTGACP